MRKAAELSSEFPSSDDALEASMCKMSIGDCKRKKGVCPRDGRENPSAEQTGGGYEGRCLKMLAACLAVLL